MVDHLMRIVCGSTASAPRLFKLHRGDRHAIVEVKSFQGDIPLDEALLQHSECVNQLDNRNVCDLALLSMLGRVSGLPQHFLTGQFETEEGSRLRLEGPDGGFTAFGSIQCAEYGKGQSVNEPLVTNVIFLLDAMNKPVVTASRERFLKISPELALLKWLHAIYQRNHEWQNLVKKDDGFSQEHSIKLPASLIGQLHKRMTIMQCFLRDYPKATLQELFAHVEPALAEYYARMRSLSTLGLVDRVNGISQDTDTLDEFVPDLAGEESFSIFERQSKVQTPQASVTVEYALKQLMELSSAETLKELVKDESIQHKTASNTACQWATLLCRVAVPTRTKCGHQSTRSRG